MRSVRPARTPRHPLISGARSLGFLAFACLVYALHLAYEGDRFHLNAAWWFAGALLLLATFVRSQKRAPAPLLDLAILKNRPVVLILS